MSNQKEVEEDGQEDSTADTRWIVGIGMAAFLFLVLSHVFYWLGRSNVVNEFGEDKWGQYGDFIGGVTNPIISLLTFGGLLYTILAQRRGLALQRWELALQRRELSISSKALKATEEELRQTKEIAAGQSEFYRKESKKSDLEKVMDRISNALDDVLESSPAQGMMRVRREIVRHAGDYVGSYLKSGSANSAYVAQANASFERLAQLNDLIKKYDDLERGSAVVAYYGMKYRDLVSAIRDVGGLGENNLSALYNASAWDAFAS